MSPGDKTAEELLEIRDRLYGHKEPKESVVESDRPVHKAIMERLDKLQAERDRELVDYIARDFEEACKELLQSEHDKGPLK